MEKALKYLGDIPIALKCAKHNQNAINFYKKYGFEIVDKNPKPIKLPTDIKMPLVKLKRN